MRFGSLVFIFAAAVAGAAMALAGTWAEDDAAVMACFAAMDREPALAVVNPRFARRDPTAAQLADAGMPSEAEAAALRLRVQKTRPCREKRLAAVRAHHLLLEPAYATLYYQSDQVFDYLTQDFVTYGTANHLARDALVAFRAREAAYFGARDEVERAALSEGWSEALQRAHSYPPPDSGPRSCAWQGPNIVCE
ncbi:MAG: hypothetical protein KBA31_19435 [Alphaproteobacteria bacterium]|nr:hypothetical protein [Alphaproteobacteria bacterium]